MKLSALLDALEALAPISVAEPWDNVGLLLGSPDDDLEGPVLLAIDLTDAVLDEAAQAGAGAIVCYHPPIFEPLKRLTSASRAGALMLRAARMGLSIYSPHTALDAAPAGMTDWLADGLVGGSGERSRRALVPHSARRAGEEVKLVTFVPEGRTEQVRAGLAHAGAGVIGDYTLCSFASMGAGTFRGGALTNPAIGAAGKLEYVAELRLEMVCSRSSLPAALAALRRAHPYEEPAIDVYDLAPQPSAATGAGRVLELERPAQAAELAARLRSHLGLPEGQVQVAEGARPGQAVRTLVVCPGAGASLLQAARSAGCEALITGEMKHHEVLAALGMGVGVLLAGHTQTERGYLPVLAERLRERLGAAAGPGPGQAPQVLVSGADRAPLSPM